MGRSLREYLFGDYDYSYLCTPQWPYCRQQKRATPMFFGRDAFLGLLTAAVMGAQHALAMTAGLITPPLLIGFLADDPGVQAYLIQAALLVCGLMTAIQVTGIGGGTRFPLQLGAGMLSVMGVSFSSVPVYQATIGILKTGFTLGTVVALILNLIFPEEVADSSLDPSYSTHEGGGLPTSLAFNSLHGANDKDAMAAPGHVAPPERMAGSNGNGGLYSKA